MTQRKEVFTISSILDDDCGIYRIGEIDTIPDDKIQSYIERHGEYGYSELVDVLVRSLCAAQSAITEFRNSASSGVAAKVEEC